MDEKSSASLKRPVLADTGSTPEGQAGELFSVLSVRGARAN
jgi:hypothetical protein